MHRTAFGVVLLISLSLLPKGEAADPAENAALQYWRAFQWEKVDLSDGPHTNAFALRELRNEALQWNFTEQTEAFFNRVEPFLDHMRIGAAKLYCDWGTIHAPMSMADVPHLSKARSLVHLSRARFKHLISLEEDEEAVALLKAAFQLSRHLDDGRLILGILTRISSETILITSAAEGLPRISSEQLTLLAQWWDRQNWPPAPRHLSETFQRYGLLHLSPFKEQAQKNDLTPAELQDLSRLATENFGLKHPFSNKIDLDQFLAELEQRIAQVASALDNPDLTETLKILETLPEEPDNSVVRNPAMFVDSAVYLVPRVRGFEVRARMFRAAIATVLEGPEALADYPEPNVGCPFIHEPKFRDRFVLKSNEDSIFGRPITLQVGRPPDLHAAANQGDLGQIKYLLESETPVDREDSNRWTALHHAAHAGQREAIELLLEHGADINALVSSKRGYMMDPAMAKRYGLKLPEVKPDENAKTALDLAVEAGHQALADFLKNQGAKTSAELQRLQRQDP